MDFMDSVDPLGWIQHARGKSHWSSARYSQLLSPSATDERLAALLFFLTKKGVQAVRPLEPLISKGLTVSGTLAAFFVPLGALILKGQFLAACLRGCLRWQDFGRGGRVRRKSGDRVIR